MLGIESIGIYIPKNKINNLEQADRFETDRVFLEQKIGAIDLPRFDKEETITTACTAAFHHLVQKTNVKTSEIECVILCTQNPDHQGLPHNSAGIHAALNLPESCACFDIGLGCSGYVYGLSIIQSFMAANGMKKGILFTCDPYSRILNENDKNTSLLFGDAASATLISNTPNYQLVATKFSTRGKDANALIKKNGHLEMDGRSVFNFALQDVPKQIQKILLETEIDANEVDLFLLHQGSKFMLENVIKRAGIPKEKAPIRLEKTGNTVSSSIPLLLEEDLTKKPKTILMTGFGVGLSWATAIYKHVN